MTEAAGDLVGLLPAAGLAARVAPLPGSKELFPVGFGHIEGTTGPRPKVAAQYLLEAMRLAGVGRAYIVLRRGKWDIPEYFGDGRRFGLQLAYAIMGLPFGVPYTLDQVYPFIRRATIVFGFPDIIIFPADVYIRLLKRLNETDARIVLGLFRARRPEKMDMVDLDARDRIRNIEIKPQRTSLTYTWICAVWKPDFTEFMHAYVARHAAGRDATSASELHLGEVIRDAVAGGMPAAVLHLDSGSYLDIGTPEDMIAAAEFVRKSQHVH